VKGALRCPGTPGEDASLLKNFTMGKEDRFGLQFRAEFYNLFNRHTYAINGCAGVGTTIGTDTFAQVTGINSNPRNGAVRDSFHVLGLWGTEWAGSQAAKERCTTEGTETEEAAETSEHTERTP